MPQTNYPLDIGAACAGQVVTAATWSGRYQCSEDLPFGRVVALFTDGQLRLPRHGDKMIGVVPYRAAMPNGGFKAGDIVSVLRKGQIWVESAGAAPVSTALQTPNVKASTTIATDRGKVTSDATSASAGVEVDAATNGVETVKTQASNSGAFSFVTNLALALLNVDFPAN